MRAYGLKNSGSSTLSQTICSYDGLLLVHAEKKHRKLTNTNQLVSRLCHISAFLLFQGRLSAVFGRNWKGLFLGKPRHRLVTAGHLLFLSERQKSVFLVEWTRFHGRQPISGTEKLIGMAPWLDQPKIAEKRAGKLDDVTESQVCPEALQNSAIRQSDQHSETRRTTRPILQIGPISQDAGCQTIWPLF